MEADRQCTGSACDSVSLHGPGNGSASASVSMAVQKLHVQGSAFTRVSQGFS